MAERSCEDNLEAKEGEIIFPNSGFDRSDWINPRIIKTKILKNRGCRKHPLFSAVKKSRNLRNFFCAGVLVCFKIIFYFLGKTWERVICKSDKGSPLVVKVNGLTYQQLCSG